MGTIETVAQLTLKTYRKDPNASGIKKLLPCFRKRWIEITPILKFVAETHEIAPINECSYCIVPFRKHEHMKSVNLVFENVGDLVKGEKVANELVRSINCFYRAKSTEIIAHITDMMVEKNALSMKLNFSDLNVYDTPNDPFKRLGYVEAITDTELKTANPRDFLVTAPKNGDVNANLVFLALKGDEIVECSQNGGIEKGLLMKYKRLAPLLEDHINLFYYEAGLPFKATPNLIGVDVKNRLVEIGLKVEKVSED